MNLTTETPIQLTEVPDHLPRRRGRRISYSTVFRWVQRGCRGKRLETCRIGGTRFTTIEALNRFFADENDGLQRDCQDVAASRQAAIEQAERALDAAGM